MSFTSPPNQVTINLGNGVTSTSTYQYNTNNMPTNIINNTYQNGILTNSNTETFTYNNGIETINYTSIDKTLNTTSSGSYTFNYN